MFSPRRAQLSLLKWTSSHFIALLLLLLLCPPKPADFNFSSSLQRKCNCKAQNIVVALTFLSLRLRAATSFACGRKSSKEPNFSLQNSSDDVIRVQTVQIRSERNFAANFLSTDVANSTFTFATKPKICEVRPAREEASLI